MPWETEIPDVVAGQPITSVWGNQIRDSIVHTVATVAALPSTGISDGDVAWVAAVNRLHHRRGGRWWTTRSLTLPKTTDSNGVVTVAAADLGLVELTWGIGVIQWGVITTVAFGTSRFGSPTAGMVNIRGLRSTAATGDIQVMPAGVVVTVDVYAEGYAT